jgi:hypothetical protein
MSLLPQRKKSPEELAKLRENLGIPDAGPKEPESTMAATTSPDRQVEEKATLQAEPPKQGQPRPVHSLKRSERAPAPESPEQTPEVISQTKPVRSLRKSELQPSASALPESPPDSKLPHHRHSDREIEEMRRREAFSMMNAKPNMRLFPAHPGILIPGYLLPLAAAAGIWFYQLPIAATAGLALVSLLIAGHILISRPISRHHAAFIAMFAVFLIVFGALYYFPQLRHAT